MKRKAILNLTPTPAGREGNIFTVQALETILIINYWKNRVLAGRYCLDTKSGEYEVNLADTGEWRRYKLSTFCAGDSLYWYLRHQREEIEFDSPEDEALVRKMLCLEEESASFGEDDVFWDISIRESDYLREQREWREIRRKQRIAELMDQVPALTDAMIRWIDAQMGETDYLFEQKPEEGGGWFCSACKGVSTEEEVLQAIRGEDAGEKETVHAGRKKKKRHIRHNDQVYCPKCYQRLEVKKRGEPQVKRRVMVLQPMDEERSIARYIDACMTWRRGRSLFLSEGVRHLFSRKQGEKEVLYYNKYTTGDPRSRNAAEFDDRHNQGNRSMGEVLLYPEGIIPALSGTWYAGWGELFTQMAKAGLTLDYHRMMLVTGRGIDGMVEYLFKGRFYQLLRETVHRYIFDGNRNYFGSLNPEGKTAKEVFWIEDKQKINRIRQRDGGILLVRWMRWSEETGIPLKEEVLDWLEKEKLECRDLNFILDRMRPMQVMHYVKRQQEEGHVRQKVRTVLSQWQDYLSMCTKEGKDVQDALVYRPRQLKRRHDEIVEEIRKREMLNAMKRNREQHEAYARSMEEKFPGAKENLARIREKFSWADEEYQILVPERLVDIVAEGHALHHCAGATERYFERIRDNETYICFLRKKSEPDVPFYTIEVEPGGTIRQHRSYYDEEPGIEEIRGFLRKWQAVIRKRMSEEDRMLAKESAIKRQKNLDALCQKNNLRVLEGLLEDFMEAM